MTLFPSNQSQQTLAVASRLQKSYCNWLVGCSTTLGSPLATSRLHLSSSRPNSLGQGQVLAHGSVCDVGGVVLVESAINFFSSMIYMLRAMICTSLSVDRANGDLEMSTLNWSSKLAWESVLIWVKSFPWEC